jgi:hypothetical protein
MKELFLAISVIIGLITPIVSIVSILQNKFRPQRTTYFLVLLINCLFVGTLISQHDRNGLFTALVELFGCGIIFILSIKKGMGGTTRFDIFIVILALISLTVWQLTQDPLLGLIMSIITDVIGFIPTYIKTWKYPKTEDWRISGLTVLAVIFVCLSIEDYNLATLLFPLYILFLNGSLVLIIARKNFKWS